MPLHLMICSLCVGPLKFLEHITISTKWKLTNFEIMDKGLLILELDIGNWKFLSWDFGSW